MPAPRPDAYSIDGGELASREAMFWLAKAGKAPTDYEVTNAYECVLDADQHAQFKREA